jgi:hypothetical protein
MDAIRWRADAARANMNYSEWIRFCLNRMSGRDLDAVLRKPAPKARVSEAPVEAAREPEAASDAVGLGRTSQATSLPLESRPTGFVRMQEQARDLAQKNGRCSADVSRGARCKLCGKIH